MALPVIPNVMRVTYNFESYLGVTPRIIHHFLTATADEVEFGENLWAALPDGLFGPMHSSFEPYSLSVIALDGVQATAIVPRPTTDPPELCNANGEILPAVCALVSLRSGIRGPRGRGRSYVGPICENTCSDGVLDGLWINDTQAAWDALPGALGAMDPAAGLAVASYVHEEANLVQSIIVERPLATQRRRQDQLR